MTIRASRERRARLSSRWAIGLAGISLAACMATGPGDGDGDGSGHGSAGAVARAVEPTGRWDVRYWFNAGCGRPTLIQHTTLRVTGDPIEYVVIAPEASSAASVYCAADGCTLSAVFSWMMDSGRFDRDVELTLDRDGTITGSGSELVRDGAGRCTLSFTADGRKPGAATGS